MSNGASWGDEAIAKLSNVDWDDELSQHLAARQVPEDAMALARHWMSLPAANKDPGVHLNQGDVILGVYMKALAMAVGYADTDALYEDNPELEQLYSAVIIGLVAQGILIAGGESNVIAPESIMRYIGAAQLGENPEGGPA